MRGKIKTIIAFTVLGICIIVSAILSYSDHRIDVYPSDSTPIRLYGEYHGVKSYYDTEYDLWERYYERGCRSLFIELPYYTAEFLNIWMKEEDNSIIDQVFIELRGSAACNEDYYNFLRDIKVNCPETVFYGIDVGHQNATTGQRYLEYLEENGLADSPEYAKAVRCIKQGEEFYTGASVYEGLSLIREDYMVENFIKAYDMTDGRVMGIFGSDHTKATKPYFLYCKLREHFGDDISTVRISSVIYGENKPYRLGFSVTGLVFMIMLFVPNIIWAKKGKPEDYDKYTELENKALLAMERFGEAAVTVILLVFPSVNPKIKILPEGIYFDWRIIMWIAALVLMILYECYWIKYFRSGKTMKDLYSSFAGYPVAGATLPVIAVFLLGLYSLNILLIVCSVILGIGHIGIHVMHCKEASA